MVSTLRYVVRRLLFTIPFFVVVSLLTYYIAVSSGSEYWVMVRLIPNLTPAQSQALQSYYHLNQPFFVGYFLWLWGLVHGNLGTTLSGGSVAGRVIPWILPTMELQIPAILVSAFSGMLLGTYSARRHNSKSDALISTSAIVGLALPAFWLGILFIVIFSMNLHLLPAAGAVSGYPPYWWGNPALDGLAHFILPFSVLVLVSVPIYFRLVRERVIDILSQDYVTAWQAAGISERSLYFRHVLRSALAPVLAVLAINLGTFLAASPALEFAFSWPGLGYGLVQAIKGFDQTIIVDIVMIMAVFVLLVEIAADVALSFVDPRVKLS